MKTRILLILFLAVSLTYAKNPYEHFGYDNSEIEAKMEGLRQNKFMLINEDTTSMISALFFDFNLSKVSIIDREGFVEEKIIPEEIQLRWNSVDPLGNHPNQIGLSPYSSFWNNPISNNDPTGLCPDCPDEVYAPISDHVYNAKIGDVSENGWEVVSIDRSMSGYGGAVYKGTYNNKTEYIYATVGTENRFDMLTNIEQVLTDSKQYKRSVEFAHLNKKEYPNISFTGHSLGGGLASANALATGSKAVTFNAAGLTENTKTTLKLNKEANITSYVIQGELVDYLQWNLLGLEAEGNMHIITPKDEYSGNVLEIFNQRLDNHYMKNILNYFNSKKE